MFGPIFLLLFAQTADDPAMTINEQEIGPAEQFTTLGPATVCMRNLVLRPRSGQAVQLACTGIHAGTLRLVLENGDAVEFSEVENLVDQRRPAQRPWLLREDLGIYLVADWGPDVRYQLEGRVTDGDTERPPRVLVTGPGLAGNRADNDLFEVVSFEDEDSVRCDRRYQYGWGVLLEGEPFDIRSESQPDRPTDASFAEESGRDPAP